MEDIIKKLKEDPSIFYIYQTDLSIYGIEHESEYTIIATENTNFENSKNCTYYTLKNWFDMMYQNNLLPWICCSLDRKYIIKEHVKLIPKLDILKLRKNILEQLKYSDYQSYPELEDCFTEMFTDIIELNLTNQLVENHRIVNFKSPLKEYKALLNCNDYYTTLNKYKEIINKGLSILYKNTDSLYKQDLINKRLNN